MYKPNVLFGGLAMVILLMPGCDSEFPGTYDVPIASPDVTIVIEEGDDNLQMNQNQDNEQVVEVDQDQETHVDGEGAWGRGRIEICHIPPGNPDNAHTIVINEAALAAHLAHGDFLGPCDCERGDAPDCSDDDLCTDEDGIAGECIYTLIEYDHGELCTVDCRDPDTGDCVRYIEEVDHGDDTHAQPMNVPTASMSMRRRP